MEVSSFEIDAVKEGDVDVFVLSGEFDAYSTPRLQEQLVDAIEQGSHEIVVDMCDVSFADMSTLSVLVQAMKRVYRRNGHLVVACDTRPVLRAIELAGLRHAMKTRPTRAQALAALRERGAS